MALVDRNDPRIFLGVVGVAATAAADGADMEKVTGIGGPFFLAKDPRVLAKWYADHLDVNLVPSKPLESQWRWIRRSIPTAGSRG